MTAWSFACLVNYILTFSNVIDTIGTLSSLPAISFHLAFYCCYRVSVSIFINMYIEKFVFLQVFFYYVKNYYVKLLILTLLWKLFYQIPWIFPILPEPKSIYLNFQFFLKRIRRVYKKWFTYFTKTLNIFTKHIFLTLRSV